MSEGTHRWAMTNIRAGFLVVEGCPECGARSSFFTVDVHPPVDEYRDGEHCWVHMGSSQAVKFDLRCSDCGETVDLSDMNALMLSTCDDADCAVGELVRQFGQDAWIYVALCSCRTHLMGKCVSKEGIDALNEYFAQDVGESDRKVMVVPCKLCSSIDRCRGIVIADVGLTEIY